jgi:hypothetical protein
MTEQEWLECVDPRLMLEYLRDKASDRKLRLFTVACCRHIAAYTNHEEWGSQTNSHIKMALATSERYADGQVDGSEWQRARERAEKAIRQLDEFLELPEHDRDGIYIGPPLSGARAACATTEEKGIDAASIVIARVTELMGSLKTWASWQSLLTFNYRGAVASERKYQCLLLRDIFGNPFRPVPVDTAWLTSTVGNSATAIYNKRAFNRLPILADALEDAGCTNADILNHCRQPGEHVRGCFIVDLVMGKE